MAKIACVAVVKNEERHIAEWIAYQYAIGFDTVILLDNLSTDQTISQALSFAETHDIRILDWHVFTADYQTRAYEYVAGRFRDQFEWMAFFDTDEFLVLDSGLDLESCLAARAESVALAVSWAIFGSSGHSDMPEGLVIENFLHRSTAAFGPNRHIKSIVRPAAVKRCINAHVFEVAAPYRDIAGRDIIWLSPGVTANAPDYSGAKLNHYFTRSWEAWLAKLARGYPDLQRDPGDFAVYNRNEIYDDSAAKSTPRVKAIIEAVSFPNRKSRPSFCLPAAKPTQQRPASTPLFSRIANPLGNQGFVLGWEAAQLGNRLSCFANLFALAERTGVPVAYEQILSAGNIIEIPDRNFYVHGNISTGNFDQLNALVTFADNIFVSGYQDYSRRFIAVPLQRLAELSAESGIIVFSAYLPEFQNLHAVEQAIKTFCDRGNGIILAGAFWHQYMDMRPLAGLGRSLKDKFRISHADGAGIRALAMQDAGPQTLRIGIHIRHSDYKIWQGGKYYFSNEQYAAIMWNIHDSLGDQPHFFCVCSDQAVDAAMLHGLPVWYESGTSEDDFAALSKCHYIIGPPSSFSTWSAFLGGAKRLVLTPEIIADLAAWPAILESAVDILYPTGGYLPGDPAARPV